MKACYIDFDLLFSDEKLKEILKIKEDIHVGNIRGFRKTINISSAMLPEPIVNEVPTKITYGPVKSKNARKKW